MPKQPSLVGRIAGSVAKALSMGFRSPRVDNVLIPINWQSMGEPLMGNDTKEDMVAAFEREAVLYACIGAIATDVSSVPIKIENTRSKEVVDRERWPSWLEMFDQPNEFESFADLRFANVIDLLSTGDFFTFWDKTTDEMWWLPAWLTDAVPSRSNRIGGYVTRRGVDKATYQVDEVVHGMRHGPRSVTRGLGMIQPLADMIEAHSYRVEYEKALVKNLGGPAGLLSTEQDVTETDRKRIQESWRQNYGGASNAGRIAVLGKGASFVKIAFNPTEMGTSDADERYIKAVLSATGVPPARLGRETANYATAREQMTGYWLSTVDTINRAILDAYNRRVMWGSGYILKPDYTQSYYMQLVLQQRIEIARAATGGRPVMSPDQARVEILGMQPTGQMMADVLEPQQINMLRDALMRALGLRQVVTQNEVRPVIGPMLGLSLGAHSDPEADEVNKAPLNLFPALGGAMDRLPDTAALAEVSAAASSGGADQPRQLATHERRVRLSDERVREVWVRAAGWRYTRHQQNLKREYEIALRDLALPLLSKIRVADTKALAAAREASVAQFRMSGGEFRILQPVIPPASDFAADATSLLDGYYLPAAKRVGDEEFNAAKDQRRSMRAAAGISVREDDSTNDFEIDFAIDDPQVRAELLRRQQQIKTVPETIQEQVRKAIADALDNGESIDQMDKTLQEMFDDLEKWEADRIASTESGSALNTAADAAMNQAGAAEKAWLHSGNPDGRPEHMHAQAEGEIPFTGFFGQGVMDVPMPYPMASVGEGGREVPPGQIINCQCVHIVTSFGD